MFEICFRELEVSDTFKKCRPFFGVDEDDRNSGWVIEGVRIRASPVVADGDVCDTFVSFVRAGVAGIRDLIPAGGNRLYHTRQPISIYQTMDKETEAAPASGTLENMKPAMASNE